MGNILSSMRNMASKHAIDILAPLPIAAKMLSVAVRDAW